jgi:hypothetical protein
VTAGGDRVDGRLYARVVAGQEAGDRQHQAGCVEILAAEGLGEGTGPLVPAALEWYITETVIYHQSKLTQQEPSGSASRRRATAAPPDRMTNPSI